MNEHPSDKTISAFAAGALPNAEMSLVANHVEDCEYCMRRVENISVTEDSFVAKLQITEDFDHSQAETAECGLTSSRPNRDVRFAAGHPKELGDYQLDDLIGRGGMGVVYRGVQRSVRRPVAIKIIRPDLLSGLDAERRHEVTQRFFTEAEAAAQIEHEHLVTVYDVGEVDGHYYYSMRYVDGPSLADVLKNNPLENHRIARYLEPVARAVHEAHRKSILHRDLKPHNILIESKSDRALVADFGLAKLQDGHNLDTATGAMLGSPPYMSPEQTRDASRVTEATDVYGLGATLYHMLTGRPPFQAPSPADIIRQLNQEEPLPPSRLNPAADRDLETICLKCLDKEPLRRYASAAAVADELLRYQKGQPIKARRLGRLARSWRWCRRNPVVACLGFTTLLSILAGSVVSLISYAQISTSYTAAKYALEREQQARDQADADARRAQQNFALANSAIQDFLVRIGSDSRLNHQGLQSLRSSLLEPVVPFLTDLTNQNPGKGDSRFLRGDAYLRLSEVYSLLGELEESVDAATNAREAFDGLVADAPENDEYLAGLGGALLNLADMYQRADREADARATYTSALKVFEELELRQPRNRRVRHDYAAVHANLGVLHLKAGRATIARDQLLHGIEIRQQLYDENPNEPSNINAIAQAYRELGTAYAVLKDPEQAEQAYLRALKYLQQLTDLGESNHRVTLNLAASFYQLARAYLDLNRLDKAAENSRRAIDEYATLVKLQPEVPQYKLNLGMSHQLLAHVYREQQQLPAAIVEAKESVQHLQALLDRFPNQSVIAVSLSASQESLGTMYMESGEFEVAEQMYLRSLRGRRALAARAEEDPRRQSEVGDSHFNLGLMYENSGRVDPAVQNYESASAIYRDLVNRDANDVSTRLDLISSLNNQATLLLDVNPERAEPVLDELELHLSQMDPSRDDTMLYSARTSLNRGKLLKIQGNFKDAVDQFEVAANEMERIAKRGSVGAKAWSLLVEARRNRAKLMQDLHEPADANQAWLVAEDAARRMADNFSSDPHLLVTAAVTLAGSAHFLLTEGDDSGRDSHTEELIHACLECLRDADRLAGPAIKREMQVALSEPEFHRFLMRPGFQELLKRLERY